jgi:hypothetical protein
LAGGYTKITKVFWFFSSEKNILSSVRAVAMRKLLNQFTLMLLVSDAEIA